MKKFVSLVILVLAIDLVQAQTQESTKQPNEQSKVTREYDENGNLIRFDSTYVKSWSSDSTMAPQDIEQLQKQMEEMFSGSFGEDSDSFFGSPFPGSAKEFFQHFGQEYGDSTMNMPGFQSSFPDFEELHQQMMRHFGQLFQSDSVQIGNDTVPDQFQFDFFGDPEEFEKIQKEFEQHFEQMNKNSSKKIGT
ncbi:hypothetical protein [Mangrovibacterium diazotrophicum]|uniref:Uncharacterized protein n=1 Tax=Mangrovibacterium diazotrophicum TaxID=1261403 RepID=A0A419VX92_9BACT|nr:hypothetical protein [Mangrovibacterium diazotrophicum]RKD87816.1 hypothetical protein BC643_3823 [Mangrovibacterium diazotrophicum]